MVIYNSIIPFKGYKAINLLGLIFVRKGCNFTATDLQHEKIHTAQMLELLIIGFYLWYLIEWLFLLFKYGTWSKAYRNIRFEKEAYANLGTPDYLKNRKHYNYL